MYAESTASELTNAKRQTQRRGKQPKVEMGFSDMQRRELGDMLVNAMQQMGEQLEQSEQP
jgi:hypothetical protein